MTSGADDHSLRAPKQYPAAGYKDVINPIPEEEGEGSVMDTSEADNAADGSAN